MIELLLIIAGIFVFLIGVIYFQRQALKRATLKLSKLERAIYSRDSAFRAAEAVSSEYNSGFEEKNKRIISREYFK